MPGYFNSQPHKEADIIPLCPSAHTTVFQLTASQGGWRDRYSFCPKRQDFNSQPHKEADRLIFMHSHQANLFQLTASQGGWRWNGDMYGVCRYISTHSLTRRLTRYRLDLRPQLYISTHSLTRRLTGQPDTTQNIELISTHSLTRRLTEYLTAYSSRNWYFNSQPHKEADCILPVIVCGLSKFQLTASQGGWQQFQTKTYLSKTDFSTYYTY